jgi:16S rRNA (uracil1498-N3)-methyltransferase
MALSRLFVAHNLGLDQEITLDPGQAHYLLHVLRLTPGEAVLVFDGENGEWRAEIVQAKKGVCRLKAVEQTRHQTGAQDLHYAFAPLKQARLDYIVQKAVELGVSRLQPVITARTAVSRLSLDRMRANAIEAAEQCGILSLPAIETSVRLDAFLREAERDGRSLVFCDERAEIGSPIKVLQGLRGSRVTALLGPEGGFSPEERALLLSKSFVHAVSLGPRIMRADTAAVAILSLINAVLGDWL